MSKLLKYLRLLLLCGPLRALSRVLLYGWSVLTLVVSVAVGYVPSAQAEIEDMPASSDVAPLVHGSNATLLVRQFLLEGVVERAGAGITLARLDASIHELHNIQGVQLTVLDIHHIADALTRIYHNAGYPFTKVIVPAQEIIEGRVTLQVVEPTVGSIHVRGGSSYDQAQMESAFSSVIGEVVNAKEVETLVRRVNGFPGLSTFSYFSKGARPNTTRINIKIQKEVSWQVLAKVDNYGVETTGQTRGLTSLTLNNPLGFADQLSLGIMQSVGAEEEENTTYGSFFYRAPLFHSAFSVGLLASNNQFDIGRDFADLGLQGEASIARADLRYLWSSSRSLSGSVMVYGDAKRSELQSELNTDVLDKEETSNGSGLLLTVNYRGEGSPLQQKLFIDIYTGDYEIEYGEDAAIVAAEDSFVKSQVRYQLRWDWLSLYSQIQWDIRAQHSDVALPSIEQISASGPYAIRGLETGFYSSDNGAITSLQWRFMHPSWLGDTVSKGVSGMFVPFVFYDAAVLERIAMENEQLTVSGAGVGVDYSISISDSLRVFGRLTVAATDNIEQRNTETDEINMTIDPEQQHAVYGEINVQF